MLALAPTVVDAIWQSFAAYLPKRGETTHPLGCHRPRISDRDCFEAILFRLVTGCSWDVAGRLGKGSRDHLASPPGRHPRCIPTPGRRSHQWVRQGDRPRPLRGVSRRVTAQGTDGGIAGPGPIRPTGARPDGSGRLPPTPTEYRLAGSPKEPTATTPSCWPRLWTMSGSVAYSARSRRCGSTGVMTPTSPAPASLNAASPTP